jgi:ribokinase
MREGRILVVGSLNADLVVPVAACPRPGETILGGVPQRHLGGKGANQAVAAARAGGRVALVGRVGCDDAGEALLAGLALDRVDATSVSRDAGPSGLAIIFVDGAGENAIVVVPGANAGLTADALGDEPRAGTALVLLQLEIPVDTVAAAVVRAAQRGIPVLLNAAPAHRDLPEALLGAIDVLVVNEHEAATMAGASCCTDPDEAARLAAELCGRGPRRVVITLGAAGLVWHAADGDAGRMSAFPVDAVDTTATGDAFCGALAVRLADGAPWPSSLRFAAAAGALAATRPGAQPSLPTRHEIDRLADDRIGLERIMNLI